MTEDSRGVAAAACVLCAPPCHIPCHQVFDTFDRLEVYIPSVLCTLQYSIKPYGSGPRAARRERGAARGESGTYAEKKEHQRSAATRHTHARPLAPARVASHITLFISQINSFATRQ